MTRQKPHRASTLLAILTALFAVALPGTASAVTVTSIADNPSNQPLIPGTLRHAIATAPNNDTITFANSLKGKTITLKGGQLVLDRSLTIQGLGVDRLAVSGANASRVFLIANTAVIADLTITKGNGTGVDALGIPSTNGGAILSSGVLTLVRCAVKSSRAAGNGGGMFNSGTGNEATECTFANNAAARDGGGICNAQDLRIQRCAIFSNTAGGSGGGVQDSGTTDYINTTIACNTAAGSGGGLNDNGATINVFNCTISQNTAAVGGGLAVPMFGSSTLLRNSIIAGNNPAGPSQPAPDVSDVFIDPSFGVGVLISAGRNLVGNTVGAYPGSFLGTDLLNVNPMLGPLKDNGGITLTMELLPGSPAIDAGNNANVPPGVTTDQRGTFSRIVNGTVDIGAFEYVAPRALKRGALADLSACAASPGDTETAKDLREAIVNIQKSLAPNLWIDDSRLTTCGELVFEYEEEALEELLEIVERGGPCAGAAQNAIDDLLLADELLARIAISEAIAGGGNARFIASAQDNLARGFDALSRGKLSSAMEFFERAWVDAQRALSRKGCCNDAGHKHGNNGLGNGADPAPPGLIKNGRGDFNDGYLGH